MLRCYDIWENAPPELGTLNEQLQDTMQVLE